MNNLFTFSKIAFSGILILLIAGLFIWSKQQKDKPDIAGIQSQRDMYWFQLHRKSNIEKFYRGVPGDPSKSTLLKTFTVKPGVPGEKPTPLPQLVGREYWKIVDKMESFDNPETAPYFLTLDVPVSDEVPYGPVPYEECNGQCDWELPGYFGLHGIANDPSKLSDENPGSSGCVRHTDEDITYLYNLLDPKKEEIRYYVSET